jgi:hypothetical protein
MRLFAVYQICVRWYVMPEFLAVTGKRLSSWGEPGKPDATLTGGRKMSGRNTVGVSVRLAAAENQARTTANGNQRRDEANQFARTHILYSRTGARVDSVTWF